MRTIIALLLILACCLGACSEDSYTPPYRPGTDEPEVEKEIPYFSLVDSGLHGERPENAYSYPFYPSMEEWKNFTFIELQEKLKVDEKVLSNLSTLGLFYACWEYPLTDSILKKEAYQERFDQILGDFAAYRLFILREDASACLLSLYKEIDALYLPLVERPMIFELLLSQSPFLNRYGSKECKEIITRCLEIEQLRLTSSSLKTFDFDEIHSLLLARILYKEAYPPFMLQLETDAALEEFVHFGTGFDQIHSPTGSEAHIIKTLAHNYLD